MIRESSAQHTVYELQLLVMQNNSRAFEQLYMLFYKDLHRFAAKIIKSDHIAEEIVSDVFVQIWKKRDQLNEIRNLRLFLYVSVKNLALTYLYKARRQKICWVEEFAANITAPGTTDELLRDKELQQEMQEAVNGLPVKCKAIFLLVREGGLKYAEVARILNLSVKTIENQMGIALKKIAGQLGLTRVSTRS